jgi:hypothetical protein
MLLPFAETAQHSEGVGFLYICLKFNYLRI